MNRRAIFTIFTIVVTDLIGFGIIIPLLPTISQSLGIKGFSLGLLTASYAIAQFISSPIWGSLSDKYGRKPILIISKAGTVIAYIIFAFSRNYYLILISRLIDGFTGGNIPAARAYISDITTKEDRSKGMALIGISFGLGFIVGPALGGIFFTIGRSQTLPGLVGAGLSLFSLILTWIFLDESHRQNQTIVHRPFTLKNFFKIFQHPVIQKILIVQFLVMITVSGFQTNLAFFADQVFQFTTEQNSLLFVYIGFLGLITQGFLARKSGKNILLLSRIGIVVTGIAIFFIAISPSPLYLFIALALNSAGGSLLNVFLPTLLSTTDSHDPEGEIMGAYEGISSLGRVIGPALISSLILVYPRPVFAIAAILTIMIVLLLPRSKTAIIN
jgi:multidrug resistance protein